MLIKPASCGGCPLSSLSSGFMRPSLTSTPYGSGVALVGEALGEDEAEQGQPFIGKAGHKLSRLIEWAGFDRKRFDIWNTVWCRPPDNRLEGEEYEKGAIFHCRGTNWDRLLARVGVVVPMGNVPLGALAGRKGITSIRGYIQEGPQGTHLVPTVHPSFIARGQSRYAAAFIHDLQKAVEVAERGLHIDVPEYVLDPSPGEAYSWAKRYRDRLLVDPTIKLAFDIETPYKDEDEAESETDEDISFFIQRIGFAYEPLKALSIPWEYPYFPAIRLLMSSSGQKVVWNANFDVPRIIAGGIPIEGQVVDGMVAWHVLHSDLPKGLGFVATFTCPYQPEWKSTSGAAPARYNATDADVELRSMWVIEEELKRTGLWEVYERDVLRLEPLLIHMHEAGMPVDQAVRVDRAGKLAILLGETNAKIESCVPMEARRWAPEEGYVKAPPDTSGLVTIRVRVPVRRCSICGQVGPTKPHFRTLKRPTAKRPQNPCAGGHAVEADEDVERFARLIPFKPSREALIRYHEVMERPLPTTFDHKKKERRISFDEKNLKGLTKRYPDDKLYALILEQRELAKLAGTYIGKPNPDA